MQMWLSHSFVTLPMNLSFLGLQEVPGRCEHPDRDTFPRLADRAR